MSNEGKRFHLFAALIHSLCSRQEKNPAEKVSVFSPFREKNGFSQPDITRSSKEGRDESASQLAHRTDVRRRRLRSVGRWGWKEAVTVHHDDDQVEMHGSRGGQSD